MDYLLKEWFVMKHIKIKIKNWVSPEEIESTMGKFFFKKNPIKKIKVGPSESMSKSKKILLILKILLVNLELMLFDFLFYQTVHLKKIFNGLIEGIIHL